jgi:alkylation response protein AidB-like acyl-CoA dehydrogenase
VSFASEPGRDDGNLPPVHIVIPDDARELDRDVLAYHREQRARRRRQRIMRLFGPFGRREYGGHAAILPLIATCVALSMLAGAMLSVITISPASAPTVLASPGVAAELTRLPSGTVWRNGTNPVDVRSLTTSALAVVPANCDCGLALRRLADQAAAAHVGVYFVASGTPTSARSLTARYGDRHAVPVYDKEDVLGVSHPSGLTVLFVYSDATARVSRNVGPGFRFGPELVQLGQRGASAPA